MCAITARGGRQTVKHEGIVVSIDPIAGLVKQIVGDDFEVTTLLPLGASPETYSPTMQQVAKAESADLVFCLGTLPFENELIGKTCKEDRIVNLSTNVELIAGSCHHHHDHHHHSADPHIWFSVDELVQIVDNIECALAVKHPDSTKYSINCQQLKERIASLKESYKQMLTTAPRSFLIYHPALGYLAKSLSLNQIALENEGKSPTPSSLAAISDLVKREGVEVMFYQKEYPLEVIKPIADILGVKLVEINPLSEDIIEEIDRVINIIAGQNE